MPFDALRLLSGAALAFSGQGAESPLWLPVGVCGPGFPALVPIPADPEDPRSTERAACHAAAPCARRRLPGPG